MVLVVGQPVGPNPPNREHTMSATLAVGTIVEFDPQWLEPTRKQDRALLGKAHRVTKVNPTTVLVENELGQSIKTNPFMLVVSDRPFSKREGARPVVGSIVRTTARLKGVGPDALLVVLDAKIGGLRLARLGGAENRYWSNVSVEAVTVVDPATLGLNL